MANPINQNFGGADEIEAFRQLRESKLYLLRQICSRSFSLLRRTMEEYARIKSAPNDANEEKLNFADICAHRKRYYQFLKQVERVTNSNGQRIQGKSDFFNYYSLNLPRECFYRACEEYTRKHRNNLQTISLINYHLHRWEQNCAVLEKCHRGLVHSVFKQMRHSIEHYLQITDDEENILQEGTLGLLTAIEHYDLNRGTRFATYARWWIVQGIQGYVLSQGKETFGHISLSAPIGNGEDEDFTLESILRDTKHPTPEEHALVSPRLISPEKFFPNSLKKRDREVMRYLFGFCDGKEHTRREAAEKFGVSAANIGFIYYVSLEKIQKHLLYEEITRIFLNQPDSAN